MKLYIVAASLAALVAVSMAPGSAHAATLDTIRVWAEAHNRRGAKGAGALRSHDAIVARMSGAICR